MPSTIHQNPEIQKTQDVRNCRKCNVNGSRFEICYEHRKAPLFSYKQIEGKKLKGTKLTNCARCGLLETGIVICPDHIELQRYIIDNPYDKKEKIDKKDKKPRNQAQTGSYENIPRHTSPDSLSTRLRKLQDDDLNKEEVEEPDIFQYTSGEDTNKGEQSEESEQPETDEKSGKLSPKSSVSSIDLERKNNWQRFTPTHRRSEFHKEKHVNSRVASQQRTLSIPFIEEKHTKQTKTRAKSQKPKTTREEFYKPKHKREQDSDDIDSMSLSAYRNKEKGCWRTNRSKDRTRLGDPDYVLKKYGQFTQIRRDR